MKTLVEAFGWYGALGLIGAFALNSFGILTADSLWYQLINLSAAVGIVTVSFYKKAWQPGVLNVVWAAIALGAFVRILS